MSEKLFEFPLENQIEVSEPLTEEKLNKLQNQVTFLGTKIKVGDKILFALIQSDDIPSTDIPTINLKIELLVERDLNEFNKLYNYDETQKKYFKIKN